MKWEQREARQVVEEEEDDEDSSDFKTNKSVKNAGDVYTFDETGMKHIFVFASRLPSNRL